VTLHRRELLAGLGAASASTWLWALGCGAPRPGPRRTPQASGEVRTWLRDVVARLSTSYLEVHALAVSRRRTTIAVDVLGAGVSRLRRDGVVLSVRSRDGAWREQVSSDLTATGVADAIRALGGGAARRAIDFGPEPAPAAEPALIDDQDLRARAELLLSLAPGQTSRVIYAAGLVDVDDALVWSVAAGRDLEQRLVRIRQAATRAARSDARPIVRDVEHAWSGGLDDQPVTPADLVAVGDAALELMTPGSFDDGERTVVLDASVVASLLDAAVRELLTADPARRPDAAWSIADAAALGSPVLTLIDDPTAGGAFGGFAFDDQGALAAPITLLDAGRVAARVTDRAAGGGRGRRPGHLADVEASPSHLRLVPGVGPTRALYTDGLVLEGGLTATVDSRTGRIRIPCACARELRAGNATGRIYADVELVGSLTALLSAVDAIAGEPTAIAIPDPADRDPRWRSIAAPSVRTRGFVRARRSRA
jgi:predicted Zn-dependent protease